MAKIEDHKKRKYVSDPKVKIKSGKPWIFHFEVDAEVAKKIIEERDKEKYKPDYGQIFNSRLRKAYGLPDK